MDAEAELAALRRRAYGPHADIAEDPAALARLSELERRDSPLAEPSEPDRGTAAGERMPRAAGERMPAVRGAQHPQPSPRSHPRWHTAMVAAVAAVTLLAGGSAATRSGTDAAPALAATAPAAASGPLTPAPAFAFASDPASRILLRIPTDGAHGHLLDLPDPQAGPQFPTESALRWSEPLGDYFGWKLWIARDQDENVCMLITASNTFAQCVTPDEQAQGALFLSVPYVLVTEGERPDHFTAAQSVGFWWIPDDTVLVLTGRTADTQP